MRTVLNIEKCNVWFRISKEWWYESEMSDGIWGLLCTMNRWVVKGMTWSESARLEV